MRVVARACVYAVWLRMRLSLMYTASSRTDVNGVKDTCERFGEVGHAFLMSTQQTVFFPIGAIRLPGHEWGK